MTALVLLLVQTHHISISIHLSLIETRVVLPIYRYVYIYISYNTKLFPRIRIRANLMLTRSANRNETFKMEGLSIYYILITQYCPL